jgi:anti-sigma factor RsiW
VTQTSMTCREVNEFLGAYLDQELEAEERGEFERHLGRCPVCVAYLENYRETIRLGRAALVDPPEGGEVPEDLVRAILASRKRV